MVGNEAIVEIEQYMFSAKTLPLYNVHAIG